MTRFLPEFFCFYSLVQVMVIECDEHIDSYFVKRLDTKTVAKKYQDLKFVLPLSCISVMEEQLLWINTGTSIKCNFGYCQIYMLRYKFLLIITYLTTSMANEYKILEVLHYKAEENICPCKQSWRPSEESWWQATVARRKFDCCAGKRCDRNGRKRHPWHIQN